MNEKSQRQFNALLTFVRIVSHERLYTGLVLDFCRRYELRNPETTGLPALKIVARQLLRKFADEEKEVR